MRYSKAHIEQTRTNIMQAALHTFRTEGFNGIGIDGIAKAAGVTSGAFYKHFSSKSDAFRTIVSEGLSALRNAISASQRENGAKWLSVFSKWYFSFPGKSASNTTCAALPMEGGCALPTLSPEISRTDPETQKLFENEIQKIVDAISDGLPKTSRHKARLSWSILALMAGGIVLARAVRSEKTATDISKSVVATIKSLTE